MGDEFENLLTDNIKIFLREEIERDIKYHKDQILLCKTSSWNKGSILFEAREIILDFVVYKKFFNTDFRKNKDLDNLLNDNEISELTEVFREVIAFDKFDKNEDYPEIKETRKKSALLSLLRLQFLEPKRNIINKKELSDVENTIKDYINELKFLKDNPGKKEELNRRAIAYKCAELLGLIEDIKKERQG